MIPYTYVLFHIPTGKKYYGVKYSKDANPKELWVSYFSSSKIVKKIRQSWIERRKKYGDTGRVR